MSADTTPRPALWKPGEVSPAHLTGEMPGDVGFDPLLLTALAKKPVLDLVTGGFPNRVQREIIMANQTPEQQRASVAWMRDAELKHARLAMLAAVGWPLAELINPWLGASGGRAPSLFNGGAKAVTRTRRVKGSGTPTRMSSTPHVANASRMSTYARRSSHAHTSRTLTCSHISRVAMLGRPRRRRRAILPRARTHGRRDA